MERNNPFSQPKEHFVIASKKRDSPGIAQDQAALVLALTLSRPLQRSHQVFLPAS